MAATESPRIAALVLAAGEGSRMKKVKQLLPWKGTTLINYHLNQLIDAGFERPYLILGAHSELIKNRIEPQSHVKEFTNWSCGIGATLQFGLECILKKEDNIHGVMISLIDQPLIEVEHYNNLKNNFIGKESIIATSYKESVGVPAIFGRNYFKELKVLPKEKGAKALLMQYAERTISLKCVGSSVDFDTIENYEKHYNLYGK